MKHTKKCPECGGTDIYKAEVTGQSTDAAGPDLLPYLGGFLNRPKFELYVCGTCGYCSWFVGENWRYEVAQKWERHS